MIAADNDPGGHALAEQIEALACETGRVNLVVIRDQPTGERPDWNDVPRFRRNQIRSGVAPHLIRL